MSITLTWVQTPESSKMLRLMEVDSERIRNICKGYVSPAREGDRVFSAFIRRTNTEYFPIGDFDTIDECKDQIMAVLFIERLEQA